MAGRRAFVLGLAAALSIGLALRLSTRAQVMAGSRRHVLGSDDAYHMRRARFAAAHFPRTIVFDPLMNFPEGGVPIWPPLYDLALAAPARVLHGSGASAADVERGAVWIPVGYALAAIALAGLLARRVFGTGAGVAAAVFVAICPAHILWTQFGHTDQHVAESATGLLVLYAFVATRDDSGPRGELAVGAALALAVLTWQGAIYWSAVIALALALEAIFLRRTVFRAALLVLALPAAFVAAATAAWLGPVRTPLTYVSFGFFQPLFLAALAAGVVVLDTLAAARRNSLSRREWILRILVLGAAAAAVLPFASEVSAGAARGVGYVLGTTREAVGRNGYISYPAGWLRGIFEARPLLADGPALPLRQLSGFFFLAPIAVLLWANRVREGRRPAMHLALAIWGAVTLFLALSQRLNVYYAAPLVAVGGTELFRFGRERAGPAVAAAVALLLLLPMGLGLRDELRAVRVPGGDLFDTLGWMRQALPHSVDAYDAGLLDSPPGPPGLASAASVLAPWSLGHRILYDAELPVVANNFGYGFLDSLRFFLAESEEDALRVARERHARWVLATDLVPRMNDYAGYLGRPPYLKVADGHVVPEPAYFRTLQSRLYDFDGAGVQAFGIVVEPLARFRLLHRSNTAIPRGGRLVARWKVFEILPVPR